MGNVFKISKVTKRVSISTKETKNSKTVKYGAVTALKDHMPVVENQYSLKI